MGSSSRADVGATGDQAAILEAREAAQRSRWVKRCCRPPLPHTDLHALGVSRLQKAPLVRPTTCDLNTRYLRTTGNASKQLTVQRWLAERTCGRARGPVRGKRGHTALRPREAQALKRSTANPQAARRR
jgi:hypothetical protein